MMWNSTCSQNVEYFILLVYMVRKQCKQAWEWRQGKASKECQEGMMMGYKLGRGQVSN